MNHSIKFHNLTKQYKIFVDNPARGKPYSSIIKACCTDGWNGEIYDPDTHVCCNGEVIEKADYAFSFFTRSQCD